MSNPAVLLWIASGVGALLFTAFGAMLHGLLRRPDGRGGTEVEGLRSQVADEQQAQQALRDQLGSLAAAYEQEKVALEKCRSHAAELRDAYRELQAVEERLKAESAAQLSVAAEKSRADEVKLSRLREELARLKSGAQDQEGKVEQQPSLRVTELKGELESARQQHAAGLASKERTIEALRLQVRKLEGQQKSALAERVKMERKAGELEQKLMSAEQQLAQQRKDALKVPAIQKQLEEKAGRFQELEQRLGQLQAELSAATQAKQKAEKELVAQRSRNTLLEKSESVLLKEQRKTADLSQQLAEARQRVTSLEKQSKERLLQTSSLEHSESALQEERRKTDALAKQLDDAHRELKRLETQVQEGQARSDTLQRELSDAREKRERSADFDAVRSNKMTQELEDVRAERSRLQEELTQANRRLEELAALERTVRELSVEAGSVQRLQEEVERLTKEAYGLRQQLSELEGLRSSNEELQALQVTHKQLRLENQLLGEKAARVDAMQHRVDELKTQLEQLAPHAAETTGLRERVQQAEARLFAAGIDSAERSSGRVSLTPRGNSLLDSLSSREVPVAVVADPMGLLVDAVGDKKYFDEMAAACGLIGTLVERARELLPLADVRSVEVRDANNMVWACWLLGEWEASFVAALGPENVLTPQLRHELSEALPRLESGAAAPAGGDL